VRGHAHAGGHHGGRAVHVWWVFGVVVTSSCTRWVGAWGRMQRAVTQQSQCVPLAGGSAREAAPWTQCTPACSHIKEASAKGSLTRSVQCARLRPQPNPRTCAGRNQNGQLGLGHNEDQLSPQRVEAFAVGWVGVRARVRVLLVPGCCPRSVWRRLRWAELG